MQAVTLQSVTKVFRHRPALFNWMGKERSGETRALDAVSLSIRSGEVLVLLGPNGSGKTTFLKLISTMLLPDVGRVLVEGADTLREPEQVRKKVGFAVASERSFSLGLLPARIWFFLQPWKMCRAKRGQSGPTGHWRPQD